MKIFLLCFIISYNVFAKVWQTNLNTVSYSFEENPRHQTIWFQGLFTFETNVLSGWTEAIKQLRPNTKILLVLKSGGGNLFVLNYMKELLDEACPDCELVTYIPYKGECSSACVSVFLWGDIRTMNKKSYLGFHSIYNIGKEDVGSNTGMAILEDLPQKGDQGSVAETTKELSSWGVPNSLLSYLDNNGSFETLEMDLLAQDELEYYAPEMVDFYIDDIYREFLNK